MKINKVKGTHDLFNDEARSYDYIELLFKSVANSFSYDSMRTPIIEHTELFQRSTGESSDIVRKEMYTFLDKGNRSITLRPELTAGIMRNIVENKLYATSDLPIKCYYMGPNFRYERPQQGRYRQFYQMGVECIGEDNVFYDAECIIMGYHYLTMLGLENVKLRINSLGGNISRNNYRKALEEYFSNHIDKMCDDCKERLKLNPLRILDCKVKEDQEIVADAPKISDYLTTEDKERFEYLCELLEENEIPYEIDEGLVRGLDYYSHVIFEFHYTTESGLNVGAVGAGGHYDNLSEDVGGPKMSGVGLAFGEERLYGILNDEGIDTHNKVQTDIYIMPLGKEQRQNCFWLANELRDEGYRVEVNLNNKPLRSQFKIAEHMNAKIGLIVGDEEIENDTIIVRNLEAKEQESVPLEELVETLDEIFGLVDHDHDDEEGE